MQMLFRRIVGKINSGERADAILKRIPRHEIAGFTADFGFCQSRLGILDDQLADTVFAAIVIDGV